MDETTDATKEAESRERVRRAKELLAAGGEYPRGCSEFICRVLGVPWESANSLLGDTPTVGGKDNDYPGLSAGDISGWKGAGESGHVAIFIGEAGLKFIDVRNPGATPRAIGGGYGAQNVSCSSKY